MSVLHEKRGGFGLLHLLLLLGLLAVAAGVAIPAWFDGSGRTLANATRLLADDLRDAQNRAAFNGRDTHVEFREDGDGYRVVNRNGEPEPAPIGKGPFQRIYSFDGIFRGIQVESVDLGGDRTLVYDRSGFASEAGTITLSFRGDTLTLRQYQ